LDTPDKRIMAEEGIEELIDNFSRSLDTESG